MAESPSAVSAQVLTPITVHDCPLKNAERSHEIVVNAWLREIPDKPDDYGDLIMAIKNL